MSKKLDRRFYVYEHWRPDTDVCFWVGKGGTKDRAYRFKRNSDYNRVVHDLSSIGMCVEVRLVFDALTEPEAFSKERERITFWRSMSVELTNKTDGGDGNRSLFVSDETRRKLRIANLGKKHSPETREKMSISQIGKHHGRPRGFKHSLETIEKMKSSQSGKKVSEVTKDKLRQHNLGKKHSIETRLKMVQSHRNNAINGRGMKGVKLSEETKRRMSVAKTKYYLKKEKSQ